MNELELLIDLHKAADRQGPGDAAQTRRAIEMSGLAANAGLRIADVGCGTGASTLVLAQELDARIAAVEIVPEFLDVLKMRAARAGVGDRIDAMHASMDALPFEPGSLDAIWSEGAVYNMGFEDGARQWRRFLKPGGVLAVTELTWLTARRPAELHDHWTSQYAQVATASAKFEVLERHGYAPIGYFVLPQTCWRDAYYQPMRRRFAAFLERQGHSGAARAIVAAEELEIALYEKYREYFGYGYYVARNADVDP